jgi:hypothetical protein
VVSSTHRPHFTPGKDPVPILQEAGWAPGLVRTSGKSRPNRNSIPDCPARSQSLYRLSYRAHRKVTKSELKLTRCRLMNRKNVPSDKENLFYFVYACILPQLPRKLRHPKFVLPTTPGTKRTPLTTASMVQGPS